MASRMMRCSTAAPTSPTKTAKMVLSIAASSLADIRHLDVDKPCAGCNRCVEQRQHQLEPGSGRHGEPVERLREGGNIDIHATFRTMQQVAGVERNGSPRGIIRRIALLVCSIKRPEPGRGYFAGQLIAA